MTKSISELNGKEVQNAILAKDIKWQPNFEELGQQVTRRSKGGYLDTESIAEIKT
jgi:hypothetical protein